MIKKTLMALSLVVALVALSGCAKNNDTFLGDWRLIDYMSGGKMVKAHLCTLTIEKGTAPDLYRVTGFSGVNTFGCTFIAGRKSKVSVDGGIESTKMAGPMEALEAENRVLQYFADTERWVISKNGGEETLELYSDDGILKFSRIKLNGTTWEVALIGGESVEASAPLSIKFTGDEDAVISTGLNTLQLNYIADGAQHSLSFSQAGLTTLTSGDERDMAAEKRLLAAILQVNRFVVKGGDIIFFSKKTGGNIGDDGEGELLVASSMSAGGE